MFQFKTAKNEATKSAEILVYGVIGADWMDEGLTGKRFAEAVNALGAVTEIHCRVNSVGGSAFEAQAMYNTLIAHPAKKIMSVEGIAASAASFFVMAGDQIRMYANAMMMIHRAWNFTIGNVDDHQKSIDMLSRLDGVVADVYAKRAGKDVSVFADLMAKESWFTAEEAKAQGLCTEIIPNKTGEEPAACVGPDCPVVRAFKNVPATAKAFFLKTPTKEPPMATVPAACKCGTTPKSDATEDTAAAVAADATPAKKKDEAAAASPTAEEAKVDVAARLKTIQSAGVQARLEEIASHGA